MYSYGPPHMAERKQDDHLEYISRSYVRIRDVAQKNCQRRWTIGKSGERVRDIRAGGTTWWWWYIYIYIHGHGRASVGQPGRTYLHQLCKDTGYSSKDLQGGIDDRDTDGKRVCVWERERERGGGGEGRERREGNLCSQHDLMIYIYIYIYTDRIWQ